MAPHINKRKPVSCENCRKRKIKCLGARSPCDSCIRRGFTHSCNYLRNDTTPSERDRSPSDNGNEEALLQRIQELEKMLQESLQSQSSPSFTTPLSPFNTTTSNGSQDHRSEKYDMPRDQTEDTGIFKGNIFESPLGYLRYVPRVFRSNPESVNIAIDSIVAVEPLLGSDIANFPFDGGQLQSRQDLLAILPPARQCDELKNKFFQVFSPLFHILHDPTFAVEYDRFRLDAENISLSWIALLFIILSIGVNALDENDPLLDDLGRERTASANLRHLASRYRNAAMRCLTADKFIWRQSLHTMQALVLLMYALYHAHGSCWPLLGLTYNIAVALGFHIDPDNLELASAAGGIFDALQAEQRRRCWAGLMMLHTVQNMHMGIKDGQPLQNRTKLPADIDDQNISSYGGLSPGLFGPTQMSYILFKFRLYTLAAEICQYNFDATEPNRHIVVLLDRKIAAEQETHNCRFLPADDLPTHHVVHLHILNSYSNQLYLLLHRPYLVEKVARTVDGATESQAKCQRSALSILAIHKRLFEAPEFRPYQWYNSGLGSFHAFLAATVLVVIIDRTPLGAHRHELQSKVEACLARFKVLSHRSEICAKASLVLEKLLYQNVQYSYPTPTLESDSELGTAPHYDPQSGRFSHDAWEGCQQPLSLVTQIPPQQWLSPAAFSWGNWTSNSGLTLTGSY